MNAKILPYIFRLIVLCAVGFGSYYAGSKNGYDKAVTQISKDSAKVIETAIHEQETVNAQHQAKVAQYVELQRKQVSKMSALKERLRKVQARNVDKDNGGLCDGVNYIDADTVRVFKSAINSLALRKETDQPDTTQEKITAPEYLLQTIGEYNACTEQLNTLIDECR